VGPKLAAIYCGGLKMFKAKPAHSLPAFMVSIETISYFLYQTRYTHQSTDDSNYTPHTRQNTLHTCRELAKSIKTRKSAPKKNETSISDNIPFKGISVFMPVPLTISVCAKLEASAAA
jgi:hypothetical protein